MNRKRSKWSYAIGCTGRDMCYTLVSMFLAIYIQYSGLMDDKQFGVFVIIMVLCKVWDAVNDPMMGTIISNTKTRLGKYRPWVLVGCLSNAIFLILLFTLRFEGEGQAFLGRRCEGSPRGSQPFRKSGAQGCPCWRIRR